MTYFQDDNGNQIEADDDLQIYKSSINLFSFTIKGNFSTSFQVPNNSYYKNNFQYFTPLQIPTNGFTATIFNMVKNGNIIERGQLILEREDGDHLYFFFISGNANWITKIPDISIRDIDYEEFALANNPEQPSLLKNTTSGFCFPLVDWGGLSKKNSNAFFNYNLDATQNGYEAVYNEFYPCFFLKSAIQSIFTYCQLQIGGDILEDPIYNQMIITPDNGKIERAGKFYNDRKVSVSNSADTSFGTTATKLNFDTVIENGNLQCWDAVNQKYVANKSCLINITLNLNLTTTISAFFKIYKNGAEYLDYLIFNSNVFLFTEVGKYGHYVLVHDLFVDVVTGDYLEFYAQISGGSGGNFDASAGTPTAGVHPVVAVADTYWTISVAGYFGSGTDTVHVGVGDLVQAKQAGAAGASQWNFVFVGIGINVKEGGMLNIEPSKYLNAIPHDVFNFDTLRASDILPDIKMIELIKFIAQYFCAIPTYDPSTSTVSFNKLDNFDYTESKDWSKYLQKIENNFEIQTAKYNYLRFNDVDDKFLKTLNSNHDLKYAEALIQGKSNTQMTNDLFKFPFGPAIDRLSFKDSIQTPLIPLVEFEEKDIYQITSVINSSGAAVFNLATNPEIQNVIALIYGTNDYDGYCLGFFFSNQFKTSYVDIPFTKNITSGYIQTFKFNFKSNQSRILFFTGEQQVSSFSSTTYISNISLGYPDNSFGYAYFSKPSSGYLVSSYKQGLNLDYYQGGYVDIPRRFEYYKNLTRILNAPYVKMWFYLPEAAYADFNFGTFIFIKDDEQQRYYYIDSIENYKDSKTLVQVNAILLP